MIPYRYGQTEAEGLRTLLKLREDDVNHLGTLLAEVIKERDEAKAQARTYRDALLALARRNDERSWMERIASAVYNAPGRLDLELIEALGLNRVGAQYG